MYRSPQLLYLCHAYRVASCSTIYYAPVSASRPFKALIFDTSNLIPKIVLRSGGPGSIKKVNFAEGSEFKYSISYEIKIESTPEEGSKGKNISTYNTKPGVEIKEEDIKAGKQKAAGVFKAVEAYLLANTDAYVN
ncbi:unnamed protein product [Fraxinus pennsylvanica]|uniref:Bet v I/Major latex protein domain-containing protein n=1 Tax=Fraxinus pennsylvanica TaxID=56036 RepID=A0AAD2A1B2_9LAMI|nr:unnamed protein product [Fraxinus pennsylvanica]